MRARLHRHLLANDGPHAELEPVHAARHAQARPRAHERRERPVLAELRGDRDGVGVEVEQAPRARHRRGEVAEVVEQQLAADEARGRSERHDPGTVLERERAAVGGALHLLDARNRARCQERDQRVAVEGLAVRQPEPDRPGGGAAGAAAPAQLAGRAGVDGADGVVELAHAPKAGAEGHLAEGQVGGLDQRARRLRALRAGKRHRSGPQLGHQDPVQLALAEVEARREPAHALAVHGPVRDQPHGPAGHVRTPVPRGRARRGVGVAALARPEALLLRGGGAGQQAHVAATRQPGRTARTAVHAGGGHRHDEEAVVARVAALHEAVAALEVLDHGAILAR